MKRFFLILACLLLVPGVCGAECGENACSEPMQYAMMKGVTGASSGAAACNIALEQSAHVYAPGTGTSVAKAFTTKNVTSGTLLVAMVAWASDVYITGVSDGTNSYTCKTRSKNSTVSSAAICYAYNNAISGAKPTITVTFNSTSGDRGIQIAEFSGVISVSDPFDDESGNYGSTTSMDIGNITLSTDCGLIVAIVCDESGKIDPVTVGSGFTILYDETGQANAAQYQVYNSSGEKAVTMTGTAGSNSWAGAAVGFKGVE